MNIIEINNHLLIQTTTGAYKVNTREMTVQPIEDDMYSLIAGISLLSEEVKELV